MKRIHSYLLVFILFIVGLGILLYPSISNWYNEQYHIESILSYDTAIEETAEQVLEQELQKARDYNNALTGEGVIDPFIPNTTHELPPDYLSILNVSDGVMGSLSIPAIGVELPIYHGTTQAVLEKGIGHMELTAFPIGGEGTHSVLTGHTGLPSAKLLTDLDQLQEGDEFFIKVQKQVIAYRVDQILVVDPDNTKSLIPVAGEDYVTIVTCTPYGINSHRLLVRGVRIPYEESEYIDQVVIDHGKKLNLLPYMLLGALLLIIVLVIVYRLIRKKRKVRG